MSLAPGTRLGPYEIVGFIAAGGMGEVYRARDERLRRDVAIKILPPSFVGDPDRLARFRREAQVLASLNHPHIASLYGFEEGPAGQGLVMELVEGPTLADRIAAGPIPLDESLAITRQIVEALEAAHAQGVVHRDLKPANIKLRPDDTVKVLDFGLAKAGAASGALAAGEVSPQSPTITAPAQMTTAGVILGTAAYMSPEQARGRPVDRRCDIWAFGAILFEMLAGARAFAGDETADTLAAVITREPDWALLPPSVPAPVRAVLRRCLQKDPHDRLHDIADVRIELEEVEAPAASTETAPPRARAGRWIAAAAAALGMLLGAGGALLWSRRAPVATNGDDVVLDASLDLPADAQLALGTRIPDIGFDSPALSLSKDGRRVAYIGQSQSGTMVYVKEIDGSATTAVAGTEGAIHAFFSPDGRTLGVVTNDKLKTVDLGGGTPVTLCEADRPVSGSWRTDGTIILSENQGRGLSRIDARSGAKSPIEAPSAWVSTELLPDGRHALITSDRTGSSDYSDLSLVSLQGGEPTVLVRGGYAARYVAPGYLLFARAGGVYAARFDADRGKLLGEPVRIASDVSTDTMFAQAHFSVSDNGVLAYVPGGERAVGRLAWVDREGRTEYLDAPERIYGALDLSDDGERVAVHVPDVTDYVWLYDFRRHEGRRLTSSGAGWPVLDPHGERVAYTSWQSPKQPTVAWQSVDGGEPHALSAPGPKGAGPGAWTPDGKMLWTSEGLFVFDGDTTRRLALDVGGRVTISPDGRWFAHTLGEKGARDVLVAPFPDLSAGATAGGPDGRPRWLDASRQFSPDGGIEPVWCPDGELFYRKGMQWLASRVRTTPDLAWDPPRVVFETEFVDTRGISYDISPDGQRLLVVKRTRPTIRDRIQIVTNWTARVAGGSR